MKNFFKVVYSSKFSKARIGEIKTAHGIIKTPAFVPVATKGTIKTLWPDLIKKIKIQTAFVNTYHLVTHPGVELIEKAGGIHRFANLNIPLMSDSGGFQVFSLAKEKNQISNIKYQKDRSKIKNKNQVNVRGEEQPLLVKISDEGVKFRSTFDGRLVEFTPENSIEYQNKIGSDIMMAFDECIYYGSSYEYAKKATARTHGWLRRCLEKVQSSKFKVQNENLKLKIKNSLKTENYKLKTKQYLYGIIQGGVFEDLRKKSAEFVVSQPVDGVAIGGVSVGESKKEMRDQVRWVADYLPKDKPVHLLGVGQFDDILDLVKYGIDTFDCVEPTRLGRMGRIYQWLPIFSLFRRRKFSQEVNSRPDMASGSFARLPKKNRRAHSLKQLTPSKILSPSTTSVFDIDIFKTIYKQNLEPVDENCDCYVCQNFTKAYLHHLFKQKEILGYSLATYHNLWVMERFFDYLRNLIVEDRI